MRCIALLCLLLSACGLPPYPDHTTVQQAFAAATQPGTQPGWRDDHCQLTRIGPPQLQPDDGGQYRYLHIAIAARCTPPHGSYRINRTLIWRSDNPAHGGLPIRHHWQLAGMD